MINVACPTCTHSFRISVSQRNAIIDCPNCKLSFSVCENLASELKRAPLEPRDGVVFDSILSDTNISAEPAPVYRSSTEQELPTHFAHQSDVVFYSDAEILVSKTRFVVGSKTFALSNISSVRRITTRPGFTPLAFGVLVGVLLLKSLPWIGLAIAAICFAMIVCSKPTHSVVLTTAGGEITAYSSFQDETISAIVRAITEAIIARG